MVPLIAHGEVSALNKTTAACRRAFPRTVYAGTLTVLVLFSACSAHVQKHEEPSSAAPVGFPRLGDDSAAVTQALANYKSDDPTDNEGDVYYLNLKSRDTRVWVAFDQYPDSSARLSQIAFSVKDGTLDAAWAKSVLAAELPSDAKRVPLDQVGKTVAKTVSGLEKGQSAEFYVSDTLGARIATDAYWHFGPDLSYSVEHGRCASSGPGMIEIYRESDTKGQLTRLLLMSMYLNLCQRPVDAPRG